ncbi:DUF5939 domain-containing protein, partial [Rhizobium ruizarguesonis]
ERQTLSMVISHGHALNETVTLRPGLLRLTLENHIDRRVVPNERIVMDYGKPDPDDPDRFRAKVTFDEQADGKTVLTLRQL